MSTPPLPHPEAQQRDRLLRFLRVATTPDTPLQAWLLYWRDQLQQRGTAREEACHQVIDTLAGLIADHLGQKLPPTGDPTRVARGGAFLRPHVPVSTPVVPGDRNVRVTDLGATS